MKKIIAIVLVIVAVFGITIVAAGTNSPGSEEDPIVSKSYVDAKVADALAKSGATYTPVQIKTGQKLIGGEGTEIILRSGEATAIDNGSNGISDVTAGKDLMTGNSIALNHLLLIPRNDGRGITANTEVWVMIRGSYSIK